MTSQDTTTDEVRLRAPTDALDRMIVAFLGFSGPQDAMVIARFCDRSHHWADSRDQRDAAFVQFQGTVRTALERLRRDGYLRWASAGWQQYDSTHRWNSDASAFAGDPSGPDTPRRHFHDDSLIP
jgi:hypothetical protein